MAHKTGTPSGVPVFCCLILGVALALSGPSGVIAEVPDGRAIQDVRNIAAVGAPALALRLIDSKQPPFDGDPDAWMVWERERVSILRVHRDWDALAARLGELPLDVPDDFRIWAATMRAQALLAGGRGEAARAALQDLIWAGDAGDDQVLALWRRLVIESYLVDNADGDAQVAVLRYRQDFGQSHSAERLLEARVLLIGGRHDQALELLRQDQAEPVGQVLALLASARAEPGRSKAVLQEALAWARNDDASPEVRLLAWAVVAECAERLGDRGTQAWALEHVIVGRDGASLPEGLFSYSSDSLWDAYLLNAKAVGNEAQLLIGDDAAWLEAADKIDEKFPVRGRSLYALVIVEGRDDDQRELAAESFLALARQREQGTALVESLFLDSRRFAALTDVPVSVRHFLVDVALARSDIAEASRVMATIQEPPSGADQYLWQLRRARILALGGQSEQAAQTLTSLLQSGEPLSSAQIDRFLQVVFDLQAVGAHGPAIDLLAQLLNGEPPPSPALARELLFWMADSEQAQQNYVEAAQLYLRSAMLIGPKTMDPWAQTARYKAADVLAKGGLVTDARRVLEGLLAVTEDASRRAALQQALQKLDVTP